MRAFVTGGTGHVGTALVEVLLKKGYEVYCMVRKDIDNLTFLKSLNSDKLFFLNGDLRSPESILKGLQAAQPDYVFHVAAFVSWWARWNTFYEINVKGTQNLFESIEKTSSVKKLIHVSTFAVYGYEDQLDAKEDQPYGNLHSKYSKSKMMIEKYLWKKYNDGKGPAITMLRPPVVFGPHDTANFIEILSLIKKKRNVVAGRGDQLSSMAYNYDIADLLIKMAEDDRANGEVFNVKTGDLTAKELILKLMGLLNIRNQKIRHVPIFLTRLAGNLGSAFGALVRSKKGPILHRLIVRMVIHHHVCNIDKAKKVLGWSPTISLDDALKETIDWFIKSGIYDAL
ncbi:MAG: NAD-dependent epimerase/dehydratase family protein [Promethearchaeota archaeon]